MGQMTYGLMYGVSSRDLDVSDCDKLVCGYEESIKDEIKEFAKDSDYFTARNKLAPSWECESETPVIGFYIAVGASGKDGIQYLDGFCLDHLAFEKRYEESLDSSRKAWERFNAWSGRMGIILPTPSVWLVECEVA